MKKTTPSPTGFRNILVANRGEIACRVIRTLNKLNIKSTAIYSDEDADSMHVAMADYSHALHGETATETYLNIEKIVKIIKEQKIDAVHPGYGFLSENALFAKAVKKAGAIFIGPSPESITLMGDKINSKILAEKLKIPTVPGLNLKLNEVKSDQIRKFSDRYKLPLIIKAAAGGGGRGMRKVYKLNDIEAAIASASREATASFGNGELFIEKLVQDARHIEVQILADKHGNVFNFMDRDCTAQRNNQKIIEEAPASIAPALRKKILAAAELICKKSAYENAGTVEFLVDKKGNFYFLEVNSRLQVEHPVTEAICGLDLVELQIRIAGGENLKNLAGKRAFNKLHAIEARICAEDPEANFSPQTGKILSFAHPREDESLRIDSGFKGGSIISHNFDSLLAKVIATGKSRQEALANLKRALSQTSVLGIKTNLAFLIQILNSKKFSDNQHNLDLLGELVKTPEYARKSFALGLSEINSRIKNSFSSKNKVWNNLKQWRGLEVQSQRETCIAKYLKIDGKEVKVFLTTADDIFFTIKDSVGNIFEVSMDKASPSGHSYKYKNESYLFNQIRDNSGCWIGTPLGSCYIAREKSTGTKSGKSSAKISPFVTSHLPGKIISIKVEPSDLVNPEDVLIIIESMKMEHEIKAESQGTVQDIFVKEGDNINSGDQLIEFNIVSSK